MVMKDIPTASGQVYGEDNIVNLYYLNELYQEIARHVSIKMREVFGIELPLTAGIWGGTYLIAQPNGKCKRRVWRFYSIVNLPQNSPLDKKLNLERFIGIYYSTFAAAFRPYGLDLDLKMWGGRLPFSNKVKPSITMHMEDASKRVRWLRAFFIWNTVSWEQSVIHDLVRNIRVLKQSLDIKQKPSLTQPEEIKFLMQDVIITYYTIKKACSEEFIEHADPIILNATNRFLNGLCDPEEIKKMYVVMHQNALIYGFEEALEEPFRSHGLDIHKIEYWPVEKINWVPEELQAKLIPPIQEIFVGFKTSLQSAKG